MSNFKLTYATMFDPPEVLHTHFNEALGELKANLGQEYGMFVNGKNIFADEKLEDRSPVNTDLVLAIMQKGNEELAEKAVQVARQAFPAWSRTP